MALVSESCVCCSKMLKSTKKDETTGKLLSDPDECVEWSWDSRVSNRPNKQDVFTTADRAVPFIHKVKLNSGDNLPQDAKVLYR